MKSVAAYVLQVLRSTSFYPLTTFWIGAMIIIALSINDILLSSHAFLSISVLAMVLILIANNKETVAMKKEVSTVYTFVTDQHDDLVKRVIQLLETLEAAGEPIPKSHTGEPDVL